MEKKVPRLHSKVGEEKDACRTCTAQYHSKKCQHRQVLEEVEMGRAADKLRHQAALDAAQLEEGEETHKRDLEILNERIVELEQEIVVERKIKAELEDRLTVLEGEKETLSTSQLAAADAHLREQIEMKTRLAQLEGERVVWGELETQVKQLDLDLQKTSEELAVEKFRSRGLRQELSDLKKKSAKSEEVGREKEARLALNVGALVALISYYYSDAAKLVREFEQHHAVAEKGWMEREELLRNHKQDLEILNERIVELEQEMMKERKVEAELENDKRKLQKQVAEVIEGRKAAEKLLEARTAEAAELASKSAVEMQEAAKAQGALEEAAAAKEVAQQKLRETQQALDKSSKDLLCAQARFESIVREFQHLQGTLQQMHTEMQSNQEALDKANASLCQQHAEAQRKLQEAAGVKESLDGKISHLEEQLARTELEWSEAKKALDTRSQELRDSQSEVEQLTELKAQLRCSTRQIAVLDGKLATSEQELRKIKNDLATRSQELAAAVDSHLRVDMNTRLAKMEGVVLKQGELEAQVKQLDLDLHTLSLPEPRRREEIVNEVKESSLTPAHEYAARGDEYATRVGMLWVRQEKTNHRVQRRFVLFNQVAELYDEPVTPYQLHMQYVCCSR
jgi:chromosome segregation ATPase